jgi:hypothetical protein
MTLLLSILIVSVMYVIVVLWSRKSDRDLAARAKARRDMYVVEDSEQLS